MIRNLIARYWRMPHDWRPGYRPLHRGRPALIAPADHTGATEDWSPIADVTSVEVGEPEETPQEAAVREAAQIVDHWAAEYARIEAEVRGWFDDLVKDDPLAAQYLAEGRELVARRASVAAADAALMPTGEYPVVRELVAA